jgi:hypothetical protein
MLGLMGLGLRLLSWSEKNSLGGDVTLVFHLHSWGETNLMGNDTMLGLTELALCSLSGRKELPGQGRHAGTGRAGTSLIILFLGVKGFLG